MRSGERWCGASRAGRAGRSAAQGRGAREKYEIGERFAGSRFTIKYYEVMDRADFVVPGGKEAYQIK